MSFAAIGIIVDILPFIIGFSTESLNLPPESGFPQLQAYLSSIVTLLSGIMVAGIYALVYVPVNFSILLYINNLNHKPKKLSRKSKLMFTFSHVIGFGFLVAEAVYLMTLYKDDIISDQIPSLTLMYGALWLVNSGTVVSLQKFNSLSE